LVSEVASGVHCESIDHLSFVSYEFGGSFTFDLSPGILSELLAMFIVLQEMDDRVCKGICVPRRHEVTGLALLNLCGKTSNGGCDNRFAKATSNGNDATL
jgi:hypothetical protein